MAATEIEDVSESDQNVHTANTPMCLQPKPEKKTEIY